MPRKQKQRRNRPRRRCKPSKPQNSSEIQVDKPGNPMSQASSVGDVTDVLSKVSELMQRGQSREQQEYAQLSDNEKRSKLFKMIEEECGESRENCSKKIKDIIDSMMTKLVDEDKEFLGKISKLESKHGKGTLFLVFDFPQDIKEKKFSTYASITAWQAVQDKDAAILPTIGWMPISIFAKYMQPTNDHMKKLTCDMPNDFKSISVVIYNNPITEIYDCYSSWYIPLTKDTETGQFLSQMTENSSYSNFQKNFPQFLKFVNFVSKDENDAKKMFEETLLTAMRNEKYDENMRKEELLTKRVDNAIDFLYPSNLCDFLPNDFDINKRESIEQILKQMHSKTMKQLVAMDIQQIDKEIESNGKDNNNNNNNHNNINMTQEEQALKVLNAARLQMLLPTFHSLLDGLKLFDIFLQAWQSCGNKNLHAMQKNMNASLKFARKIKGNYCDYCNKLEQDHKKDGKGNFNKCDRCQSVWYCSTKCQKLHWKNQHRQECRTLMISRNSNADNEK